MKELKSFMLVFVLLTGSFSVSLVSGETDPILEDKRIKNYLPHMSWKDVKEALAHTDMVIVPVGSVEQHGPHLPLGTDFLTALKTCQLIAQEVDVLVAPALMAGLSDYHMGFPGTITLTPETFEAVMFESARSLIRHGFKKIIFYNGHGGNTVSLQHVIRKINQTTSATAVMLNGLQMPPSKETVESPRYDWHAGEMETSEMLYLTPGLVEMTRAEKPVLTFPPEVLKTLEKTAVQRKFQEVAMSGLFCPQETGKKCSTRELTSNGVVTAGDPGKATTAKGKAEIDRFVKAAAQFIREWKNIQQH